MCIQPRRNERIAIRWPQARVHVFGSTATKLNLPNADVDVAIVNIEGSVLGLRGCCEFLVVQQTSFPPHLSSSLWPKLSRFFFRILAQNTSSAGAAEDLFLTRTRLLIPGYS